MSPTYDWVCHLCSAVNSAGTSTCARCGFSAEASPVHVSAAQAALGIGLPQQTLERTSDTQSEAASLSVSIAYVLLSAVLIVGALLGRFAGPIWLNVVGIALIGVAFLGVLIIERVRNGNKAHG